jgi:RNA polymerase sigma-70 factor (ECF subfamily)
MTVNESLNVLKSRKQTTTLDDKPEIPAAEDTADEAAELQRRVGSALMSLKPDDRAVMVLRHFVFFSYEEIADVLEIPVKTVKSRLFTARERLRLILRERVA